MLQASFPPLYHHKLLETLENMTPTVLATLHSGRAKRAPQSKVSLTLEKLPSELGHLL